jgi:hypothetical protein
MRTRPSASNVAVCRSRALAIDPVRLNPDAGLAEAAAVGVALGLALGGGASVGGGVELPAGDGVVPSGGGKVAELPEQPATARAASRLARPSRPMP